MTGVIGKLKKSSFGQWLYVRSRGKNPVAKAIRTTARAAQSESVDPVHLSPANQAHNRKQRAILKAFEADLGRRA